MKTKYRPVFVFHESLSRQVFYWPQSSYDFFKSTYTVLLLRHWFAGELDLWFIISQYSKLGHSKYCMWVRISRQAAQTAVTPVHPGLRFSHQLTEHSVSVWVGHVFAFSGTLMLTNHRASFDSLCDSLILISKSVPLMNISLPLHTNIAFIFFCRYAVYVVDGEPAAQLFQIIIKVTIT